MATVDVHYFTGTGNTARAVHLLTDKLKSEGYEVSIIQVKKGVEPAKSAADIHIIAFPVLSWSAPDMMKQYLSGLPKVKGTPVILLAVNGSTLYKGEIEQGFTGQALEQVERIVKKKGYDVRISSNVSYPDNWTQMTNPCDNETNSIIIEAGDKQVQAFTEKILSGERSLYRCGTFNAAWSWLISFLFGVIGRKVMGTFYIADQHCTGCSLCAKLCPAGTIVMKNDRPQWRANCEDCNRCINICPEKAIQVSIPVFVIQIVLNLILTILFIVAFLDLSSVLIVGLPVLKVLIDIVLVIFAIWLGVIITLYPITSFLCWLTKFPVVRKFFSKSQTSSFRRYIAPGFFNMIKK